MIHRIIFLTESGVSRAPMAALICGEKLRQRGKGIESLSRGYVVHFPEPMNQKTVAILTSKGFDTAGFEAQQLQAEDVDDETIVFTMSATECMRIIDQVDVCTQENTFVLSEYVGDEIEIINPYGGDLTMYGLCFEVLSSTLDKCLDLLIRKGEI